MFKNHHRKDPDYVFRATKNIAVYLSGTIFDKVKEWKNVTLKNKMKINGVMWKDLRADVMGSEERYHEFVA